MPRDRNGDHEIDLIAHRLIAIEVTTDQLANALTTPPDALGNLCGGKPVVLDRDPDNASADPRRLNVEEGGRWRT